MRDRGDRSRRLVAVGLVGALSLAASACGGTSAAKGVACGTRSTVTYASYPGVDPNLTSLDVYIPPAGDHGCVGIIQAVANQIDAREFNPRFPKTFPRFVQNAIWRYCSENGLDVCNGNRIDDKARCGNLYCQARRMCDRVALHPPSDR